MNKMLIDTHAHLTMPDFNDLEEVLSRAKSSDIKYIINASFDMDSSIKSVDLAKKHKNIFAAIGIHPHHANALNEDAKKVLNKLCNDVEVVAIGETGLDYFQNPIRKDVQKESFLFHLDLAKKNDLPIILHGRSAEEDMLEILKDENVRGVFHCFSSDKNYAKKVLDMGFFISFTAIITFKNAEELREVVRFVPLDFIMLETDCPYLAPQIYRGKRNEPSYLIHTANKIAEIKKTPMEAVAEITTKNAIKFFSLKNT